MAEIKDRTLERLNSISVSPAESLGQHFLVDSRALGIIAEQVNVGSTIIEVGVGTGTLTEAIAPKASSLVGIEIDKRFAPFLADLKEEHQNTSFLLQDALTVNLGKYIDPDNTQIFANLPFHITEPFLTRLIDLPIINAVLILGEKAAEELSAQPGNIAYGRMSLLAQTFFSVNQEAKISKQGFYPVPRTDAAIVTLTPRRIEDIRANRASAIFAQIFRDSAKHAPVINSIKDALMAMNTLDSMRLEDKQEHHQRERSTIRRDLRELVEQYNATGEIENEETSRRRNLFSQGQALELITQMGISESVLRQPFMSLNNSQLRDLARAVNDYYLNHN